VPATTMSRSTRTNVQLANLDLNLLVSLDVLLQERSVTRAAARLGLSQPTLSTTLARLRSGGTARSDSSCTPCDAVRVSVCTGMHAMMRDCRARRP